MSDAEDRLAMDEILVRGFVLSGAAVWAVAALGALFAGEMSVFYGYGVIALFVLAAFVTGLYFERIAATELTIGAGALLAWGITAGWDAGLWMTVGGTLLLPMVAAAGMYYFAELEEVTEHVEQAQPMRTVHA